MGSQLCQRERRSVLTRAPRALVRGGVDVPRDQERPCLGSRAGQCPVWSPVKRPRQDSSPTFAPCTCSSVKARPTLRTATLEECSRLLALLAAEPLRREIDDLLQYVRRPSEVLTIHGCYRQLYQGRSWASTIAPRAVEQQSLPKGPGHRWNLHRASGLANPASGLIRISSAPGAVTRYASCCAVWGGELHRQVNHDKARQLPGSRQ